MADRAGIKKEYDNKHFLVDEAKFRKVCDVIHEHAKRLDYETSLTIYVEREDSSYYETKNIDEVVADDNVAGKEIRTILVELNKDISGEEKETRETDRKPVVYLALTRKRDPNVVFLVSGEKRDWSFLLADELDSQIQRFLVPHNLKWLTSTFANFSVVFIFGAIILMWLIWFINPSAGTLTVEQIRKLSNEEAIRKCLELLSRRYAGIEYAAPGGMIFTALMLGLVELRPVSRLASKLSKSVFYWGDMITVRDRFVTKMTHWKYGVIGAFIVSVVASIIASKLLN